MDLGATPWQTFVKVTLPDAFEVFPSFAPLRTMSVDGSSSNHLRLIKNHKHDHRDRTNQNGSDECPNHEKIIASILFLLRIAQAFSLPLLCVPSHQGSRSDRPHPQTFTVFISSILTRNGRFPVSLPLCEPSQ